VDATELQQQNDELRAAVQRTEGERDEYRRSYELLLEAYRKLEKGLLGQKSERLPKDETQLTLDILGALLGREAKPAEESPEPPDDGIDVAGHKRRYTNGRKPLPEHLPRVIVEVIPLDVQLAGLDAFERIGEEISEVIERRPSSLVVVQTIRPKFIRKERSEGERTEVIIAEPLELPIERGLAGPGLLADTIVKRWQDHLPLNRLEGIYGREGLELARSTIGGWHETLRELAEPLWQAMLDDARTQPYLCTDATGVLVQAKEKCRRGHFWVLVAPSLHVLFNFSRQHDSAAVDELLGDYAGYLVADAHSVYDHLFTSGKIVEVGCWAHARRYFFKALATEPQLAREALAMIGELFRIERDLAGTPHKAKKKLRRQRAGPIVERFLAWCDEKLGVVLDGTPIHAGVRYASNQADALRRYLDDGRLPLHNNGSELQLRRQAVGRKNWLFVGSDEGARNNAVFVSLLASCQMHGIEPWAYLRDLLCLLPTWPARRVLELAPAYWNQTLQDERAQQLLADNMYRRIVLGDLGAHRAES
jgi:transposase